MIFHKNIIFLNYGNYTKIESYLFRKNLINELKTFKSLPKGDVKLFVKNPQLLKINKNSDPYEGHKLSFKKDLIMK